MKPLARLAAVLAALVLAGAALSAPAVADTVTYMSKSKYLESAKINNSRGPLLLTARADLDTTGDAKYVSYVWDIDADGDRAAEFYAYWGKGAGVGLEKQSDTGGVRDVRCARLRVAKLEDGTSRKISIPRRCLKYDGDPATSVRVKLRATVLVETPDGLACRFSQIPRKGYTDWVRMTGETDPGNLSAEATTTAQRGC